MPERIREERGEGKERGGEGDRSNTNKINYNFPLQHTLFAAGLDYVSTTTELTFQPSTTSACGNVGRVKNDVIVEGPEFFLLLLSSQNDRVHIQNHNTAQVTIEDDDGMCVCVCVCAYAYA